MHIVACRYDLPALNAFLGTGADITLVVDAWEAQNRPLTDELLSRLSGFHVVASFDDMKAISELAEVLVPTNVDRVLSLAEYGQLGAAYLATLLGKVTPSIPLSVLVRDKRSMKRVARAAGIPCARQTEVHRDTAPADAEAVGYPLVLKPASGMGTVDTWFVADTAELVERMAEAGGRTMIAEEYVTGQELHVDAVWRAGELLTLGVSRYLVPRLEITRPGHDNGSAMLRRAEHEELYSSVEKISHQVNEALGITDGITHAEYFVTEDGRVVFSEIATRPGGGAIPQVFEALGADLREVWARSVAEPAWRPDLAEPADPYLCWVNIAPHAPGRVVSAPTREQFEAFDYVRRVTPGHQAGAVLDDFHPSIWSWFAEFSADSWEQFAARTAELEAVCTFEIADESGPA